MKKTEKISRFRLFLVIAKENNDIDRTVASVEVVEAIMQKLGITSSIEELVKSYNMPE